MITFKSYTYLSGAFAIFASPGPFADTAVSSGLLLYSLQACTNLSLFQMALLSNYIPEYWSLNVAKSNLSKIKGTNNVAASNCPLVLVLKSRMPRFRDF